MARPTTTAIHSDSYGTVYVHGDPEDQQRPVGIADEEGRDPVWLSAADAHALVAAIYRNLAEANGG